MRRVSLTIVLALAVVVAAAAALAAAPGERPAASDGGRAAKLTRLLGVNFVSTCRFSHRNEDDMIVFPGQHGLSHDHTYVGNTSTNGDSTLASLLSASTTCGRPGDTAAYWVPTLYQDGVPVEPLGATIYYRRRTIEPVRPFPSGLEVIAGSARATSPQSRRVTFWSCGPVSGVPPSSEPPTCPDTGRRAGLRLHVRFPDCWDGWTLDSADHQSHMAYSVRGRCPRSHPLEVPAIAIIVRYPTLGGPGLELASGGVFSAHADFVNAWDEAALARLVDGCLNALRHCGRGR
jgi:hypothetical protein